MEIKQMQKMVDDWVKQYKQGYWKPSNQMLSLTEEVGELAREINHNHGQKTRKEEYELNEISEEIGDILFVLTCIANNLGINLEDSINRVVNKFTSRDDNRYEKVDQ